MKAALYFIGGALNSIVALGFLVYTTARIEPAAEGVIPLTPIAVFMYTLLMVLFIFNAVILLHAFAHDIFD